MKKFPGAKEKDRQRRRDYAMILRSERLSKQMELVDVAKAASLTPRYLKQVELGELLASKKALERVAKAVGCSTERLERIADQCVHIPRSEQGV